MFCHFSEQPFGISHTHCMFKSSTILEVFGAIFATLDHAYRLRAQWSPTSSNIPMKIPSATPSRTAIATPAEYTSELHRTSKLGLRVCRGLERLMKLHLTATGCHLPYESRSVTRHKWTHPALIPDGDRYWFIYPGGIEGWVDLGDRFHIEINTWRTAISSIQH